MKLQLCVVLFALACFSCKISEESLAGTYQLKTPSKTKLVLNKDRTFDFIKNFSGPGPLFFPDSTEMNFRTSGTWKINSNGMLELSSYATGPESINRRDSVIHNTSLTSLSFWDSYGDPVSIRFIKFLPDKIKLYRGNSISFFREDFKNNDTLEFHFYGYNPVKWPSPSAQNYLDNHSRHIVLYEEHRQGYFNNVVLSAEKKKLISADGSFALYRQ